MAEDFEGLGRALVIPQSVINNLNKIDEKINLIASDSEKMATHFTSAMTRMGNGSDGLLQKLQAIQGVINKLDLSKFAQSVTMVGQGTTQVEQFTAAISKAAEAINKYNTENRKRTDVDNSKQIAQLNKEIEAMRKRTQQLEDYINKQRQANQGGGRRGGGSSSSGTNSDTKALNAYNRAMAASEALVTQRINKIAKLRQAEEMLTNASGNYEKQIKRIRQEIERLNKLNQGQVDAYGRIIKSQRNLMDTSGQLERKLALIFSVSQIEGYIMKLVKVRGEFELQNTALASILQNKDQADKLFGQITELAVKSPFTVKELTTYTKSLSAYSVEYEKLYDTTKMLADVSAGLGVDMQRLILAFGQVKAANFLRGTETRQFTEAGINMLGELAKYYSELEGRIVSVGEVQERQFKRMISSQDVEQVFKRLTSAGGMFYDMQERQAETLAGMMSNLQDSIDLMLNDIGKGNESVIKDMIKNIRSIIENWREVAWYLEKIATAFVVYKGAAMLAALGNSAFVKSLFQLNKTASSTKINLEAMKKVLLSFGRGLASAGLLFLVSWLVDLYRQSTKTSRELEELGKSLNKITSTDASNLNKMVSALDDLIARIKLSNEGSQERRDIISSLNNNYGEYLDFVVDETTSIKDLTDAYDGVVKKMKEKAALATLEKGYQEINQFYEDNLTDARKQFEKELSRGLSSDLGFGGFKKSIKPTKDEINDLFNILQNRIRETDDSLLDSSREQRNLLQDIVKEYYGNGVTLSQDYLKTVPLIDLFLEKKKKEEELQNNINGAYKETLRSREANIALTKRENQLELEKEAINNQQLSSFDAKRKIQEAIEKFELDKIDIKVKFGEISQQEAKRQKDVILNWATNTVKDVNARLREELKGYSEEDLSKVLIGKEEQATGLSSIQQTVKQNWETQVSTIEQLTKLKENNISVDEKLLANAQKLKVMYEAKARILGVELESKKESVKSDNSALQRLKDQIALIKKAGEEYKKLRQYYSEEEATAKIRESFKDAFSNLSLSTQMDFDVNGVIKALEALNYKVVKGGKEAVDEVVAPLKTQQDIDVRVKGLNEIQKQLDDVFAGYELSVELEKMGLDNNLIGQLFNVDTFSLDDVRKNLDKMKPELISYGKEGVDIFNNMEKKITEMQQNELQERLKSYAKYLKKSVSERVAIEMDAQKKIEEVRGTKEFTPEQQDTIIKNIKVEAQEKLDKLSWEDFQGTDEYIQLFEDLEYVSTSAINKMLSDLEGLRDSLKHLPPDDLKEIVQQMERLKEIKIQRNPFKYLFSDDVKDASKAWGKMGNILNEVSSAASNIASSLENVFGTMDDKTADVVSSFSEIASGVGDAASGVSRIMAGDIIGGGIQALQGIVSTIGSIFAIGDKKKEREIQRQIELIENLQRSYEKLEQAIEDAYSIDTYKKANEQAIANLEDQNEALQAAINAERDKKKTDNDRIKEWEEQYQDNLEKIQELNEEFINSLGGFGSESNVKSAAQEFADAWLEAYLETGDGLDALSEKWDEYIQGVIAKQLMLKGTEKYLKPVMDMLDGMLEDAVFSPEEASDLQNKIDEIMPLLNEFWKGIAGSFDLESMKEGDTMSSLSRGISSVTEETAQALEALLSSMRFFVSDSNTVLHNIYNAIAMPNVENPFLTELKIQSNYLNNLNALVSSVIKNSSGKGKVLRVEIA